MKFVENWGRLGMKFNIWKDCPKVPITELLSFIVDNRGKTVPTADDGWKLIATNCVTNNTLFPVYEKVRYLTQETYETWFRAHPMPGDILFVNKGTPGRVCMVPDPVDFCIAQDMIALRADDKKIYNKYLFAVLRSREIQQQIYNTNVGDVIPHFKKQFMDQLLIPVPDRKIQEKIGNLYYQLSYKVELNKKINENLLQQAQTLFYAWFVEYKPFGGIQPSDWKSISVYDLAEYINGAAFKKHEYADTGLPIIKIAELKNGITESTQHCCVEKDPKYYIKDRDILFSWSGNPETSIDTFVWSMGDAILNQHTFRVVSKYEAPAFTFFLLKYLKPQFTHIASNKQTTGLGHVTVKDLKRLQFCTDRQAIKDFNDLTMPIFEMIYSNCKESQGLSMLRDALLPKLMSGEIDISSLGI